MYNLTIFLLATIVCTQAAPTYELCASPKIYAFGGVREGEKCGSFSKQEPDYHYIFDGRNWTSVLAPLATSKCINTVFYKNKFYAIERNGNQVATYDGYKWVKGMYSYYSHSGGAVAVYNGDLMRVGGDDGSRDQDVEIFTYSWRTENSLPFKRMYNAACDYQGQLLSIGGRAFGSLVLDSVDVFDGLFWSISSTPLPHAIEHVSCREYRGLLYVVGIYNGTVSVFNYNGKEWNVVNANLYPSFQNTTTTHIITLPTEEKKDQMYVMLSASEPTGATQAMLLFVGGSSWTEIDNLPPAIKFQGGVSTCIPSSFQPPTNSHHNTRNNGGSTNPAMPSGQVCYHRDEATLVIAVTMSVVAFLLMIVATIAIIKCLRKSPRKGDFLQLDDKEDASLIIN
eukprot:m.51182 g.51182  ORF g.51182 m.51182 type:complete len:396 (+) comp10715_c0_seq1:195-1382(+)